MTLILTIRFWRWPLLALLPILSMACTTSSNKTQIADPVNTTNTTNNSGVISTPAQTGLVPVTEQAIAPQNPAEYKIGPQDLIDVNVFRVEELSGTVRVNGRGFISLPLIGSVEAQGLTSEELEERIESQLARDYLQDPKVTVFIKEYASQRITLDGAVGKPGIFALSGETTLLQAMAMAGGLGPLADPTNIKLFRGPIAAQKEMLTFDLEKIRAGEVPDPPLQGNDVIVVAQSGNRAFLRDSLFRDTIDLLNPFNLLF